MRAIACISKDGQLVPASATPRDDKLRFRALTAGYTCFVGGKTWRELPEVVRGGCGARRYEVLSNTERFFRTDGAATFKGYELQNLFLSEPSNGDAWVIGGNSVYSLCMPYTTMLYLSILRFDGGVGKFPFPNLAAEWEVLCDQSHVSHNFMIWKKK